MSDNFIKKLLTGINSHFRQRQLLAAYKPNPDNLKINRKNGIFKNFMRLANKTMIGINKIHISRGNLFASISGMLAGYLWSEMEDVLLNVKRNYESETKKAIITQVLQNQQIKDTLNRNLLQNVYKNKEIQYSLHELLDWKVIHPQQNNLFQISKKAILQALYNRQVLAQCISAVGIQLQSNQKIISNLTLDFLESDKLVSIVIQQIADFFKSQIFYNLLAHQIISNVNSSLKHAQNRDNLYNFCRQHFLNW